VIKLLKIALIANLAMVILSIGLAVAAVLYKPLQESLPFLVAISILAIGSAHSIGALMAITSMKEIKEIKKSQ
jgi:hypothetical protein